MLDCINRNLSWQQTCFKLLRVHFSNDLDNIVDINYEGKIIQIKNIVKHWSKRILTIISRITVVKTLLLVVLNHLIITLPNPSDSIVRKK